MENKQTSWVHQDRIYRVNPKKKDDEPLKEGEQVFVIAKNKCIFGEIIQECGPDTNLFARIIWK